MKAFLNERQDDWREGMAAAFTHFGGVPRTRLGDNARALVVRRDRATGTVILWRPPVREEAGAASTLAVLGRDLMDYAAVITRGAR